MTPQPSEQPSYARWVERVAQALHDDCQLEWQAVAVADPDRQITMHADDAHYGNAHDLVRRLGLAAPDPVASPLALKIEADGSISRISGGPLEQPVYTKGAVGPFWDEIEAWRDGYRAGLSEAERRLTEGDGT